MPGFFNYMSRLGHPDPSIERRDKESVSAFNLPALQRLFHKIREWEKISGSPEVNGEMSIMRLLGRSRVQLLMGEYFSPESTGGFACSLDSEEAAAWNRLLKLVSVPGASENDLAAIQKGLRTCQTGRPATGPSDKLIEGMMDFIEDMRRNQAAMLTSCDRDFSLEGYRKLADSRIIAPPTQELVRVCRARLAQNNLMNSVLVVDPPNSQIEQSFFEGDKVTSRVRISLIDS